MEPEEHIGEEIRKHLNKQERTLTWLADEIDCDVSNLSKKLKQPFIHTKMLRCISKALNVDLFVYHSQRLEKK